MFDATGLNRWPRRALGLPLALLVCIACGAVYPEVKTPLKPYPPGRELAPPPPEDILYIEFAGATIPERTRDGRQWDRMGGDAPDAFAQLFVDDREIIKTPVESNTLEPTWPDQTRANYRIPLRARLRVELWDSNALNNQPICVKKLRGLHGSTGSGEMLIRCDSGARVKLKVERARPKLGLGFYYELRTQGAAVSRVLPESPAARAGLKRGDVIVKIDGKKAKGLDGDEIKSLINSRAGIGLDLVVEDDSGERAVQIKAGAVYTTAEDPPSVQ